jgi:hypothetical protein
VADTTRTLTLREVGYPPVQYIPLDDVNQTLLVLSETRTYCPYKGDASYYTITLPEGRLTGESRAARSSLNVNADDVAAPMTEVWQELTGSQSAAACCARAGQLRW